MHMWQFSLDIYVLLASTSDLQLSTAIKNELPGQLFSTQIDYIGLHYFKFITALIVSSAKIV